MNFEITGKLIEKGEINQRTESFKTREFVIEVTREIGDRVFSDFIKFQCTQDRTAIVDPIHIGETITVSFNIRGTKWNKDGKDLYFTNLDAWRISSSVATPPAAQQTSPVTEPTATPNTTTEAATTESNDVDDDLPF